MHFLGTCVPQQPNNLSAGGAADDGVVDEHHPLALHRLRDGVELDAHLVDALILTGGDEGAADVLVLDEAHAVGDTGFLGVTQRCVQPGVGHAHHHVGVHRVLLGQNGTGTEPGGVDGDLVDDGVGTGEIDVFKDAGGMGSGAAVALVGVDAPFIKHQNLTGL